MDKLSVRKKKRTVQLLFPLLSLSLWETNYDTMSAVYTWTNRWADRPIASRNRSSHIKSYVLGRNEKKNNTTIHIYRSLSFRMRVKMRVSVIPFLLKFIFRRAKKQNDRVLVYYMLLLIRIEIVHFIFSYSKKKF